MFYNKNACNIYNAKEYIKGDIECILIVKILNKRIGV